MSRDRLQVKDVRAAMAFHAAGPATAEQRIAALEQRVAALEQALEQAYTALAVWQRSRIGRRIMSMLGEVPDARDNAHDDRRGAVRGAPMGN